MSRWTDATKSGSRGTSRPGMVVLATAVAVSLGAGSAFSQPAGEAPLPAGGHTAARRAFDDDKFGLRIDWGVYSLLGEGAWVMDHDKLPSREYAKLPARFNPSKFDADAWVKLAKGAGAKYITITSKHHDGFCMFASRLTDFDVVDATPYHRDPLEALADACHEEKILLFLYYSLLDWHHPDYFPLGKTGRSAGRDPNGDWKRYVAFYQGQLRELCSNYGEIGGIWLDGWSDRPDADWDLAGTYRLIHELQPGALVANNHHVAPFPGEDFQVFEQGVADGNAAGLDKAGVPQKLPLETCLAMRRGGGYDAGDSAVRTSEQIIHALVGAAGRGANLLLEIAPGPDGTIAPEISQRLQEVGTWLGAFGATVYGTRRGPIPPQSWGVSTARGSRDHPSEIYLHVLAPKDDAPIIADPSPTWTPHLFGKANPLPLTQTKDGRVITLPKDVQVPIDTIIVLSPVPKGR